MNVFLLKIFSLPENAYRVLASYWYAVYVVAILCKLSLLAQTIARDRPHRLQYNTKLILLNMHIFWKLNISTCVPVYKNGHNSTERSPQIIRHRYQGYAVK